MVLPRRTFNVDILTFSVSKNGWTTDKIGLEWIHHFNRHTRSKTVGSKRLLVLDNHGSHTTPEVRSSCEDHNIILLWMPPHTSRRTILMVWILAETQTAMPSPMAVYTKEIQISWGRSAHEM
jgi:hypothetical protein